MSRENSRWTYINGSRAEGCVAYDDDTKFHSHNDTDPARGQHSAFDLVRLHKYGHLDTESSYAAVTDRPSYKAMVDHVNGLPARRAEQARNEFVDLGEPSPSTGVTHEHHDTASRFTVYSADEFGSGPPLEWLVRGVLPRAELAVIFGESGSGKSFFALDLCAAIARGRDWRDRRTAAGGVVYVCAEGSRGFKARLKAYAHANEVSLAELPAVIPDAPNLLEPKQAAELTAAISRWADGRGKVDVIVIDTLSATAPGGNENSGEDMGLVLSHCKFLARKTGALVVLIHHSGKDATKGARGWSGLRAAADAEIEIVRNGDYRAASITKMKDGSDGEKFGFKLKVIPLELTADGEEESSCVIEHTDAPPRVEKKLKPAGDHQRILLEILQTSAPSGSIHKEDLFDAFRKRVPDATRARVAERAVTGLIARHLAYQHGEGDDARYSLTSLITPIDNQEWLK